MPTEPASARVAVIVRAAGERTEAHCAARIKQQIAEDRVVVLHESPFSQAVYRAFEIGVEYGLEWTLCIDADVLVGGSAIADLIQQAESQPTRDQLFAFQGQVWDRLLNRPRTGGLHLYQTRHLATALQTVEFAPDAIRPEAHVKYQMQSRGYHIQKIPLIVGLHDFEQYFKDIYRKTFVHARRHSHMISQPIMWRYLSRWHDDYKIALEGWQAGHQSTQAVRIDINAFPDHIDPLLAKHGLTEKSATVAELPIDAYIQHGPPEFRAWQKTPRRFFAVIREQWHTQTPGAFIRWLAGAPFRAIKPG
jgi:hypothetical protein